MLFPVYIIGFLHGISVALLFPVIPPYAASLGADIAQVGVVVGLHSIVAAITQPLAGMFSDRIGRRLLLIVGTVLSLLSYLLYIVSPGVGALMMVRVLHGFATAIFFPVAGALVVDIVGEEKRGEAIGLFTTSTQVGNMIGPALGGFIMKGFGSHATFLTSAFLISVGLFVVLFVLRFVGAGPSVTTGSRNTLGWLKDRNAVVANLAVMFVMVGIASIISFLPLYGGQIGIDISRVGLIIGTVYFGSMLTRALAGRASDRMGRVPVILAGTSLCAVSIFLVSVFTREIPLHVACFILGVGMGAVNPASSALIADVAPVRMRGFAMGFNGSFFYGGQALGSAVLGMVAASAGFSRMYFVTAIALTLVILTILVITFRGRKFSTATRTGNRG